MSTDTETAQAAEDTARTDPALLKRTFDVEIAGANGRTIDALCVPFNKTTEVNDGAGPYREMFVKGAFARATRAPFRVWLNFEHKPGFQNVIGNGVRFEERDDGLYGELEIDEGQDGDKALRFVNKNILRSLSVEFKPMSRDVPNESGVVVRKSVHLDAVALCRQGAYEDAKVLAVRTDPLIPEEFRPIPLDPSLVERCRQAGIKLPQRYQAHPDETGTPAPAGTPEDGTRPDGDPSS